MNTAVEILNTWGAEFSRLAWPMFWQSATLIVVLLALDGLLRRRVRAAVRYGLWLVVLVKLLLPPTLALPTGAAWWVRTREAAHPRMRISVTDRTDGTEAPVTANPSPVVVAAVDAAPRLSGGTMLILVWVAVASAMVVLLAVRWRQVARRVRRATPAPAELEQMLVELGAHSATVPLQKLAAGRCQHSRPRRLRYVARARLLLTDEPISPAVCGLFRPVILLPRSLGVALPPAQLRAVLLHELTHLRRGDVWVNCFQALTQIAYWWHPLVWLANGRIRQLREEVVDDTVMLALADEADVYAPTLIEIAKLALARPMASLGLVGILESRGALRQRIERLIHFNTPGRAGLSAISLMGIALFAALAVPMGAAPPRVPAETAEPPPAVMSNSSSPTVPGGTTIVHTNEPELFMRIFRFDPASFAAKVRQGIDLGTNSGPGALVQALLGKLSDAGIVLPPQRAVFLNDRDGKLFIRGTMKELDAVEQFLSKLNLQPPREQNSGLDSDSSPAPSDTNTVWVRGDMPPVPGLLDTNFTHNVLKRTEKSYFLTVVGVEADGSYTVGHSSYDLSQLKSRLSKWLEGITPGTGTANLEVRPDSRAPQSAVEAVLGLCQELRIDSVRLATSARALDPSEDLPTRLFKIDPNTFALNLGLDPKSQTPESIQDAVSKYMTSLGISMSPPNHIIFNDRNGTLLVRAPKQAMETIEKGIEAVNLSPAEVNVKVTFVEAPEKALKELWNGRVPRNGDTNVAWGILTEPARRDLMKRLETISGAEFITMGEVTTLSGRQAQMSVSDMMTVVKALNAQSATTNVAAAYSTEQVPVGSVLDVVPTVNADGVSINLSVTPSVTQFLGYDDPGQFKPVIYADNGAHPVTATLPLPRFRVRSVTTTATVWSGQTLVLSGPPGLDKLSVKQPKGGDKQLIVLITPTIVDAAGNRVK